MQLQGKTDARFIEAAFKVFRDKFGLRPVLTAPQFLEQVSHVFSFANHCAYSKRFFKSLTIYIDI